MLPDLSALARRARRTDVLLQRDPADLTLEEAAAELGTLDADLAANAAAQEALLREEAAARRAQGQQTPEEFYDTLVAESVQPRAFILDVAEDYDTLVRWCLWLIDAEPADTFSVDDVASLMRRITEELPEDAGDRAPPGVFEGPEGDALFIFMLAQIAQRVGRYITERRARDASADPQEEPQ